MSRKQLGAAVVATACVATTACVLLTVVCWAICVTAFTAIDLFSRSL